MARGDYPQWFQAWLKGQGLTNRERALGHQKASGVLVTTGEPTPGEGSEGDFTLRKIASGLVLYIKWGNIWYDVNNLSSNNWEDLK